MQIHWAIFGELNKGHALLGASGNEAFAAKLTVLTDRPGNPPVGLDWGPVVSGFPFGDQYVFLRCQPDPTVGRAGMVRSYAAFLPLTSVGELNNLLPVFARLPSGLTAPPAVLAPLQVDDARLAAKPDPLTAVGSMAVARLLSAPETKLPLVWTAKEPYLPAIATLWAQLPASLRAGFSFLFQFDPEHRMPVTPTIIATLLDLVSRWSAAQLIPLDLTGPFKPTAAQNWFAGLPDGAPFNQVLSDYAVDVSQFAKLNLISQFADLVTRLPELSFAEARRAVNIAAKHSRLTAGSAPHRAELFARLCALTRQAPGEELAALRNLEEGTLTDLIPSLQQTMADWIDAKEAPSVVLLELAAEEPASWWSRPFLEWLKRLVRRPDAAAAEQVIALAGSLPVLNLLEHDLPVGTAVELRLVGAVPARVTAAPAEHLLALAVKRGWMRLHATILARSQPPAVAVAQHADAAGKSSDGFVLLQDAFGFAVLARVACRDGAPNLVQFVGGVVVHDAAHLRDLPAGCAHGLRILRAAVEAAPLPLAAALRSAVATALHETEEAEASFADLCAATLKRDVTVFHELEDVAGLLECLPPAQRDETSDTLSRRILEEVAAARSIHLAHPAGWEELVDADAVLLALATVPRDRAARAGVSAFRSLPFLTDAQCRQWLIGLFTRTEYEKLPIGNDAVIADFLGSVDFPASAAVVRETALDFKRWDVTPIYDRIRYKYQMAGTFQPAAAARSSRLPPVLIATALTLERDEVIKHLPNYTYDYKLHADVALWPPDDPKFQVYVTPTGAGNLSAQGAVLRFMGEGVKPKLAFFMGVCGAVKDSDVGDVVYSTKVYYYEGGKEEDTGVRSRPADKDTHSDMVQLAHRVANKPWQPVDHGGMPRASKATPAVFGSGELVLASVAETAANFQRLKQSFNDTQVVDMEAYGFLKAMHDKSVQLSMVVRGVSDKLAGKAESDAKGNQPLAARNAAAFLFALLADCGPLLPAKKRKKKDIIRRFFSSGDDEG